MNIVHERCAGLDVHKRSIMACVSLWGAGGKADKSIRQFGTMTADIFALAEWLEEHKVTHVAMESTGVYWKPIYNLLDERFKLLLCNAKHFKQVPGRKTDVKDCEWIADLLQHGLMRASFVPSRPQRELRDLTRQRALLTKERAAVRNRIEKVLEDANIKLAAVATDILGLSGRDMLNAIAAGKTSAAELAQLARGKMKAKRAELTAALSGGVTDHHRFMLKMFLEHIDSVETFIVRIDTRLEALMADADQAPGESQSEASIIPFAEAVELLDTIPGVDVVGARAILAEIGTDMSRFPTAAHLASWAGVCPGNNRSAGRSRSGKTTGGSRWLRQILGQCASAAARTRDTYLRALYRRLARGGAKRAVVAVSHAILKIAYALLTRRTPYKDLGPDYFDLLQRDRRVVYHRKRLEALGYDVDITEKAA